MFPHRAKQAIPAFLSPFRRAAGKPPGRDFSMINTRAGTEPIRPEFSDLATGEPASAVHNAVVPNDLSVCWTPSADHRRRVTEMAGINREQVPLQQALHSFPPVLTYSDDISSQPTRVRPNEFQGRTSNRRQAGRKLDNRADLEAGARRYRVQLLQPRPPGIEDEYLLDSWNRRLLPHHARLKSMLGHLPAF